MFALEYNNPETLGPMSIKNKILNAIFSGYLLELPVLIAYL